MIDDIRINDEMLAAYLDGNANEEEIILIESAIQEDLELSELNDLYDSSLDWEHSPWITKMSVVDDDWAHLPEAEIDSEDDADSDNFELELSADIDDEEDSHTHQDDLWANHHSDAAETAEDDYQHEASAWQDDSHSHIDWSEPADIDDASHDDINFDDNSYTDF